MGRGKGRGGRSGRGGIASAAKGGVKNPGKNDDRVCKPTIQASKFPTSLLPTLHPEGVPRTIEEALKEDFSCAQPFFNALERMYPDLSSTEHCWMGVTGDSIQSFERSKEDRFSANITLTNGSSKPVFLKRVHIMDPIVTIEGESAAPRDGALPAPREAWLNTVEKVTDPMNEAYVDAVFACIADRFVASNISPHWCRCFGTFAARVERYLYNISEEYPSLRRKTFWHRNLAKGIFQHVEEAGDAGTDATRSPRVIFSDANELVDDEFETLELPTSGVGPAASPIAAVPTAAVTATKQETNLEADDLDNLSDAGEFQQKLATPKLRLKKLEDNATDDESSCSTHSSDFNEHFAEFHDYPVQVSLLEKVEGTLDELLEADEGKEYSPERDARWKSWIFQVIAALDAAQYYFGFVHNDLHTNNVMWSRTEKEFLYYKVHKGTATWILRVPTHGYIMKIIDFGRASFHLPEPAGFFISDAFFPGNDACNQYNCEPFFDPHNGKRVEPNPSFDLSRLSVSMLETLYPVRPENATPIKYMSREGSKTYAETVSGVYNLLWEWLIDDAGKNILRTPDGKERYPDFDLYSAIAGEVHKAVPAHQIEKPLFAEYRFSGPVPSNEIIFNLWAR